MARTLLAAALLALTALPWSASAQDAAPPPPSPFAALDIVPAGEQRYDIVSGRTELPDGGRVVDAGTGIEMVAERIVFVEGVRIDAEGVEVLGSFGRLLADRVAIDVPASVLTASGALRLQRGALSVVAAELRFLADADLAAFAGPVVGSAPEFEAAGLLLDARTGTALLLGPYRFRNGPLTLSSDRPEGRLELLFEEVDGEARYRAASEVSEEALVRFADLLP